MDNTTLLSCRMMAFYPFSPNTNRMFCYWPAYFRRQSSAILQPCATPGPSSLYSANNDAYLFARRHGRRAALPKPLPFQISDCNVFFLKHPHEGRDSTEQTILIQGRAYIHQTVPNLRLLTSLVTSVEPW